jgi:hypothetical protein
MILMISIVHVIRIHGFYSTQSSGKRNTYTKPRKNILAQPHMWLSHKNNNDLLLLHLHTTNTIKSSTTFLYTNITIMMDKIKTGPKPFLQM